MLKETRAYVTTPIRLLINRVINERIYPDSWKIAIVTPVPKKGHSQQPADYRPVSLLSVVSKIAERHISNLLKPYIEPLLPSDQFGFRPKRSTEDALLIFEHRVMKAMNECDGKTAAVGIFFDAEKAYDMCPHDGIISSLALTYKAPPILLHLVKSFLTNRTQTVRVDGVLSSLRSVRSGVPQGSIIASLLFIAYMAPVQKINFSASASTVGYADDLCYIRAIQEGDNGQFETQEIERDIYKIKEAISELKMKLNVSKTKAVIFSLAPTPPQIPALSLDGELIEVVPTYKYLGIWVDRKLCWNIHTKKKISEAKQALGTLSRCRRYLPSSVTRLVYKTVIQPKFLYATAVCYPKNKNDQIAFEYVNKYAASLISDCHTGTYDECIASANLEPIWKISAGRRLSLFRAYVDNMRFLPNELLSLAEAPHRLGLRSSVVKPEENQTKFAPPIDSRRQQCVRTALSLMISQWNSLPNSIIQLPYNSFKKSTKTGEIIKHLIEAKVLILFEVPVRHAK
jgi:retron-type reverse transcriptase